MSTPTTYVKIQNYTGNNSFVIKMKENLTKYGRLTDKQMEAAEKIMSQPVKEKVEMSEDMKKIANYDGVNNFVKEIKSKLEKYGNLTDKQVQAALRQIQSEEDHKRVIKMNVPTIGETIKVGRRIGENLKKNYDLKFNPILLDITKVLGITEKSVKFEAKLTEKRGKVCCICARTLTDELSMLSGVGKLCSEHVGIPYLTDKSQAESFRNEYLKKIKEIGTMEVWVPKSQIKVWNGDTEVILKMV